MEKRDFKILFLVLILSVAFQITKIYFYKLNYSVHLFRKESLENTKLTNEKLNEFINFKTLVSIKGIGKKTAYNIINSKSKIRSINDIKNLKGIGRKKFLIIRKAYESFYKRNNL
jgi:ERCC4-type nuclease